MSFGKYSFTVLFGAAAAAFHVVYVLYPYFAAGRHGEAVGWRLMLFDFPISWSYQAIGLGSVDPGWIGDIFLFGVGGTVMYAGVAGLVGLGIDKIRVAVVRAG
jgi:hypothetical protein